MGEVVNMSIVKTIIAFADANGNPKAIRKTTGGMIPFDVCEGYRKADGTTGYKTAISSSILSIMQWSNGNLKIKLLGVELTCFPATLRPQAQPPQQPVTYVVPVEAVAPVQDPLI